MPLNRYIKQPLGLSLGQYTDAELRKIETAIAGLAQNADALDAEQINEALDFLLFQSWAFGVTKAADQSLASDNTVNPDPDLVLPLAPGLYDIESGIIASCATAGVAFAYNHMFSATIQSPPVNCGMVGAVASVYDTVVGPGGTAFTFVLAANVRKTVTFRFIVEVLTPGNLVLHWSQGAANVVPVILHKGSYLRARLLA